MEDRSATSVCFRRSTSGEYSRFALDGLSACGYTIDISAVVGIIFFEIGIFEDRTEKKREIYFPMRKYAVKV
ncbi:hypothetical protein CKAN_00710800 [Cinnamomum micranthum f. kanehirae]|uniref:Uncharacterized protein n=1 Tax=Cinnamomum micranthum f. kanehirae TaxID=337451 RepID=A0A443NJ48_9MAGN|nr:hypothetical protein CKAN_00710800 [Cinnamomum micranthum f. kanehirae]